MNIWLIIALVFAAASLALAFFLASAISDRKWARGGEAAAWRVANKNVEEIIRERAEHRAALEALNRDVDAVRAAAGDENEKLRAEIVSANDAYEALRARRNVAWPRPATRMPSNEVKRAFALDDNAPVWIALNQVIDSYLMDLIDDVSPSPSQSLTAEVRTHLAGGIEHVRLLQKQLLELHAAAQKVDADLEGEPEKKA